MKNSLWSIDLHHHNANPKILKRVFGGDVRISYNAFVCMQRDLHPINLVIFGGGAVPEAMW